MLTGCDNPATALLPPYCVFLVHFAPGDGSRRELALVAFGYPTTRNSSNVVFYQRDLSLDSLSNLMSSQKQSILISDLCSCAE